MKRKVNTTKGTIALQGMHLNSSSAVHTAGTGRIQVVGKERESLYADMGSWIDPRKMEEQMMKKAASGSGGKRKLTAAEVKAAKLRKQEIKETKQRAWLMD